MILFFDTETTGLVNLKIPPGDYSQPDIVQIAAVLTDDAAEVIMAQMSFVIQPPDKDFAGGHWVEPKAASIHGIDDNLAKAIGIPRRTALSAFTHLAKASSKAIAFNADFDNAVIETACIREQVRHHLETMEVVCAMKMATPILKLPKKGSWGKDKYKWPNLAEAHKHFTGRDIENAHDALADVIALIEVWKGLAGRKG